MENQDPEKPTVIEFENVAMCRIGESRWVTWFDDRDMVWFVTIENDKCQLIVTNKFTAALVGIFGGIKWLLKKLMKR